MYKLLIAEDDFRIREAVRAFFSKRDFKVYEAADGLEAVDVIKEQEFDIVLLDIMMPGLDGFNVCRALRSENDTPVIFITARTAEEDQLRGFRLKADDYVTKPFSLPILHAKSVALIERHRGTIRNNQLEVPGVSVDLSTHRVTVDGTDVEMQAKVYSLLVYLMENKGRILTRDQILDHVWGEDAFSNDRVVDTTIKKLRSQLGRRSGYIKTIIKVGYKFQEDGHE